MTVRTTTYLGFLLGLAVVALAVRAGGGDGASLTHGMAWLVVLGGALAAGAMGSTLATARHALDAASSLLITGTPSRRQVSATLVELARQARAGGVGALDPAAVAPREPFLAKGLQLVVEGAEPERLEELLRLESERRSSPRAQAAGLLRLMGRAAALVGCGASLLTLVQVPGGLLGQAPWPSVAAALPAACYGLLLSGLLFLPLAAGVRALDRRERLLRGLMIRGLVGLRLGQNPEFLRDALRELAAERS